MANPNTCIIIDVFGQRAFTASKNIPFYTEQIHKSCEEIRGMWKTIPNRKEIKDGDDEQDEMDFPE